MTRSASARMAFPVQFDPNHATLLELEGGLIIVHQLGQLHADSSPLQALEDVHSIEYRLQSRPISLPKVLLLAAHLPDLRNFNFRLAHIPTSFEDSLEEYCYQGLIPPIPSVNNVKIVDELVGFNSMSQLEKRRAIRLCVGLLRAVGNAFVNTRRLDLLLPYDPIQGDVVYDAVHDLLHALHLIPNNVPVSVEVLPNGEYQIRCTYG